VGDLCGRGKSCAHIYATLTAAGHDLRWRDTTQAAMPQPDEATTLEMPEGVPLLIHTRATLSADGIPLALEETRLSAEHAAIGYDTPADLSLAGWKGGPA
jgi:GntR family transcriptional regulator